MSPFVAFPALPSHPADAYVRYRPLVESTVRRLRVPYSLFDDASQEGAIALLTAFRRYNPESPVDFSVFARPHIRGAIIRRIYNRQQVAEVPAAEPLRLFAVSSSAPDDDVADRLEVHRWIKGLAPEDAWIIRRVYWDDAPRAVIAQELGLSERRINQRHLELLALAREAVAA